MNIKLSLNLLAILFNLTYQRNKQRWKFYNQLYQQRREQKIKGEWNPVLSDFSKLIFSYSGIKDIEEIEHINLSKNNDATLNFYKRFPSSQSNISDAK